jgi:hypothetical protein
MKQLIKKLTAKLGYQTDKKQILILSDDWGSVRLKSLKDRESLRHKGIDVDANRFDQFDCLESNKDLEGLFEILTKHKDHLGNHPCITAVTNVANPNFEAINDSGFKEYHFERIVDTHKRYPGSDCVFKLTKEGIANKIFLPQSHVREHLQINWWMAELQNPESMARKVFEEEFFFLGKKNVTNKKIVGLGGSLNCLYKEDFIEVPKITKSALKIFSEVYGYKSNYICPPAQFYPEDILPILSSQEIKWLDVARTQKVARLNKKPKQSFRILGQKSKYGFKYLVRNAVFETNFSKHDNGVNSCIKDIQDAFDCNQPAIISNHRASFVGGIEEQNRARGLKALDALLIEILIRWPDVEFININDL